jgi:hypothetical protein
MVVSWQVNVSMLHCIWIATMASRDASPSVNVSELELLYVTLCIYSTTGEETRTRFIRWDLHSGWQLIAQDHGDII